MEKRELNEQIISLREEVVLRQKEIDDAQRLVVEQSDQVDTLRK